MIISGVIDYWRCFYDYADKFHGSKPFQDEYLYASLESLLPNTGADYSEILSAQICMSTNQSLRCL